METTELKYVLRQTIELPIATNSFPALSSPARQSAFCSVFQSLAVPLEGKGLAQPDALFCCSTLPPPRLLPRHPRWFWQQSGCSKSSGRSLIMSSPPLSSLGFGRIFGRVVFLDGISQPPEGDQHRIPTSPDKRNCCFNVSVNSADKILRATLHVSSYLTWVFRVFPQHTQSPSLTLALPYLEKPLWKLAFRGILTPPAGYWPLQLECPQKRETHPKRPWLAARAAGVQGECPALTACSHQMHGAASTGAFLATAVSVNWWQTKLGQSRKALCFLYKTTWQVLAASSKCEFQKEQRT